MQKTNWATGAIGVGLGCERSASRTPPWTERSSSSSRCTPPRSSALIGMSSGAGSLLVSCAVHARSRASEQKKNDCTSRWRGCGVRSDQLDHAAHPESRTTCRPNSRPISSSLQVARRSTRCVSEDCSSNVAQAIATAFGTPTLRGWRRRIAAARAATVVDDVVAVASRSRFPSARRARSPSEGSTRSSSVSGRAHSRARVADGADGQGSAPKRCANATRVSTKGCLVSATHGLTAMARSRGHMGATLRI